MIGPIEKDHSRMHLISSCLAPLESTSVVTAAAFTFTFFLGSVYFTGNSDYRN